MTQVTRRMVLLAAVVVMALGLAGCFRVEQFVDLTNPDEGARMHLALRVDKTFAGAELDLFLDAFHQTFPVIGDTAEFTRSEEQAGFDTWTVYEWITDEKHPLESMPFSLTERDDGGFEFDWSIPAMDGFSEQTESDSILLAVAVALPRDVDFANTMETDGKLAVWELRKADLAQGARLRAMTE